MPSKSTRTITVAAALAFALAGCASIPAEKQASAFEAQSCGAAAESSGDTPVVAVFSQTGPTAPPLDSARANALGTIVDGAINLQARLLLNGVTSGAVASSQLDETMTADGPNELFRKQSMACKRRSMANTVSALAKQPRLRRVDVISALRALADQLQTTRHGPVNVALLGSMLTTTQLANDTTLNLAGPGMLANPEAAINTLARSELNFRCSGWRVAAVDPGYTPDGTPLSPAMDSQLEAFWQAYFAHCGGALTAWTTQLLSYPVSGEVAGADTSQIPISVSHRRHQVVITLHSDIAFALNSAVLQAAATDQLASLIPIIDRARGVIRITGYTDSTGAAAINGPLSRARARSVAGWIRGNTTVPAERVSAAGRGAADPVATNVTAAGRARNRRVVMVISTT